MKLKTASLFTGAGGFDLAADWMGWDTVFTCEIDQHVSRALKFYWPHATHHTDIKTTDFTGYRGRIDLLTGGFPCQPFSRSGKGEGASDDRFLWPEMYHSVREIEPPFVVAENVRGLLDRNHREVFSGIISDLEHAGYTVSTFLLPSKVFGSPDERYRTWLIFHRDCERFRQLLLSANAIQQEQSGRVVNAKQPPYTQSQRWVQRQFGSEARRHTCAIPNWRDFPTESPFLCGDDGLSDRLDGVTLPTLRRQGIKAMGNAIKPQMAYMIYQAIEMTILKLSQQ